MEERLHKPFALVLHTIVSVVLALTAYPDLSAKNYIRYHQRSLVVQEYMVQGEHAKALALLDQLDKRFGLMPTETFARALCQVAGGDTAAARNSYLKSIEQRASLGWLFVSPPRYTKVADSLWYLNVRKQCEALWDSRPQYADGLNPGMPTSVSGLNARHQFLVDSLGAVDPKIRPEAQRMYDALVKQHDQKLDSMLNGQLQVPSIATLGISEEFATFVIHCSSKLTTTNEKTFKRWLKAGVIYPVLYATPFDDLANEEGRPIPYGIFSGLKPEEFEPGHEARRAKIGMGDDRLEKLRFNRGG